MKRKTVYRFNDEGVEYCYLTDLHDDEFKKHLENYTKREKGFFAYDDFYYYLKLEGVFVEWVYFCQMEIK